MYGGPRLITCHDIKEVSINARILTLFKVMLIDFGFKFHAMSSCISIYL